ncbi:FecR family protein [Spirochaeta isovalerica]|uniref:FecR protein domain-containing protein n=1 Tax=Spirochaeta isovalerica TaxID=150 RepID=A0A841RBV7_9SPIO|nr:FecR family protein [Spirochaeta isovalerica]MBB6480158.1 hypothetical protein [Spirochaeta isovalerica]
MKTCRIGLHSLVFPTILILFTFQIWTESHISYLEGMVTIIRDNKEISGDFGTPLFERDRILTGPDSLAVLEIESRCTLKLKSDTTLVLETAGQSINVSLRQGGLFSRIKKLLGKEYNVRTGDTVAGVRGTEFFVAFGETIEETPDIWLCVNEGAVEVALPATGESLIVREGEGITIPAGNRLTTPRSYSWTADLNWNIDPDKGELKDETDLSGAYADLRDFDYD